jgi:hypothetical protein
MGEIKFRFWNKELKRMSKIYGLGIIWESLVIEWGVFEWKNIDSLQYTGLKDSKGKEIYEEDIIQTDDFSYGIFNAVVRWNEEEGMFAIRTFSPSPKQIKMPNREWDRKHPPCGSDGCLYAMWYTPIGNQKGLEVIGNIYENPDLLEH